MAQITVTVPDQLVLGRNGQIGTLDVDWSHVPQHALDHIAAVYFPQYFTDAANSGGKDSPMSERLAFAQKRLDMVYSGELRVRNGSSAEPIDPVEREAFNMARDKLTAFFKSLGIWPKKGADKFQVAVNARRIALHAEPIDAADYIAAYVERNPKITAAAKKIVAERAKSSDDETDLAAAGF
jgi:hypothetical protein